MWNEEHLIVQDGKGRFCYKEGVWSPIWALLMIPFLVAAWPLYRIAGKAMDWTAAWMTVVVFEGLLMPAERQSLRRGHWVYNESRILGPRVFGVPVEEPFLYYLFSPIIILLIFHNFLKLFDAQAAEKGAK